jgi:t-SNARE complex subunit (syntaxin)
MTEALTSNLILELNKSAQEFNRWAERQVDYLEASDATFEQTMEECECTMAALKDNESHLEILKIQQHEVKNKQIEEINAFEGDIAEHKNRLEVFRSQMESLEREKVKELNHLDELQKNEQNLRKAKERSLNDLTRGIRLYRFLGLEFEKAENESMKFSFSHIDPTDTSRVFYFFLLVDSNDQYQLVDSKPTLNPSLCSQLVCKLNEDNNIAHFVVNMRRAFQMLVKSSSSSSVCI